jgi:hypothetical protein
MITILCYSRAEIGSEWPAPAPVRSARPQTQAPTVVQLDVDQQLDGTPPRETPDREAPQAPAPRQRRQRRVVDPTGSVAERVRQRRRQ